MLKVIGPTIYISSAATVLLISTLMGQAGMFKLQFPAVYLFSVAINALTTRYWPSENHKESRREFLDALIITTFSFGTTHLLFGPWANSIASWLSTLLSNSYIEAARGTPVWITFFIALFCYEAFGYIYHRVTHTWEPLWRRIHSVHHEPETFGVALLLRLSYAEFFILQMTRVVILKACGIDPPIIISVMVISIYGGIIAHTNTSLKYGFLNKFFNTPNVHIWHHGQGTRANYSFGILIVFDRLAGTYYCPESSPARLGIDGTMRKRSSWETLALRSPHLNSNALAPNLSESK